jgi:DNA-binding NarL/FixJ family response regulator
MSGEETFDGIRRLAPALPILVASGYGEDDITRRFAERQPAGAVQKPFDLGTLVQKLRAVLGDAPHA